MLPDGLLRVVAAVIRDPQDRVLLSLRRPEQHQGGLWEFPGGKVAPGESATAALVREMQEELGILIEPSAALPLINVTHAYPDKTISLEVMEIFKWRGDPRGCEGQRIEWVQPKMLTARCYPAANLPIVTATCLPRLCLVTPEPQAHEAFLVLLEQSLIAGVRLVQLRAKSLSFEALLPLAQAVLRLCRTFNATLLVNGSLALMEAIGADGLHLNSAQLQATPKRPIGPQQLLSAACHTPEDFRQATRLGVDFGLLGPVLPTDSHPGARSLGWARTRALIETVNFPVYALGGQTPETVSPAIEVGCQGIAAISGLWGITQALPGPRLREFVS